MHLDKNPMVELAARARHGEATAQRRLQQELERNLVHVVRRSLLLGAASTPLERRILAEANRVRAESASEEAGDTERLIRLVAQSLCAKVITSVRRDAPRIAAETVAHAAASAR